MAICVEYLAIFRRTDTFCDSAAAFTRLLQINSDIVVTGGMIIFKTRPTCKYELTSGDIAGKCQRYFQLKFTWDGDPEVAPEDLTHLLSFLRTVRSVISNTGGETETLHDDVSTHYAQRAYPLIHDIENLMRRLIANFLLVTVGVEWTVEALPGDVADAVRRSKRKSGIADDSEFAKTREYLNVLHTLDFIHLGNILFDAYSKRTTTDLYLAIENVKTVADAVALQDFVPQSNWRRYFAQIMRCDDAYLESRWKKLYLLRCKVAHNALMERQDFTDIEKLVGELKPKLVEALGKLPQVTVPPGDVESVAESAARNINAAIGEFVSSWQQLEAAIARRVEPIDAKRRPMNLSAQELLERGILDEFRSLLYDDARRLRNQIVHGPSCDVPVEEIQATTADIRNVIECVAHESYLARIKAMSKSDLDSTLESLVSDSSYYDITDSDAFCSAQASTNAELFVVDEYNIADVEFIRDKCRFRFTYSASGEQNEDMPNAGDTIIGEVEAEIDWDGYMEFQRVTAKVDYGDEDRGELDVGDTETGA